MTNTTAKTLIHHDLFGFYEGDTAAFLDHRSVARVQAACGAIQTLTAVMMQHALDADGLVDEPMVIDSRVSVGLLEAIACCTELVNVTVAGFGPNSLGDVHLPSGSAGAKLMRETARKASRMRRSGDKEGGAA